MPTPKRSKPARVTSRPEPIRAAVLAAIDDHLADGRTVHALAKLADVYPSIIHNFRSGGDLSLATLDRLARPLGLALVQPVARARGARRSPPARMSPKGNGEAGIGE